MSDPELQAAVRTINLLVDALEKIEAYGCSYADEQEPGPDFICIGDTSHNPCAACLAHEALETFRGR